MSNKEQHDAPALPKNVAEAFAALQQAAGIAALVAIAHGRPSLATWATDIARTARHITKDEDSEPPK